MTPRCLALIPALFLCGSSFVLPAALPAPRFRMQEIDHRIEIGYGVKVADVDGEHKPDILLADKSQIVWYRNPTWEKFVLVEHLTTLDNVCIAAADIDGDGRLDIIAWGRATKNLRIYFNQGPKQPERDVV